MKTNRKGQLSLMVIGVLIAVTLTVLGIFSRNQFDELELQRLGIQTLATETHFETLAPTPILNLEK